MIKYNGRPKPTIVAEFTDENRVTEQVLLGEEIWAVTYKDKPIGLKALSYSSDTTRYKRTMFTTQAPAANLATRLNCLYKTNDFGLKKYE